MAPKPPDLGPTEWTLLRALWQLRGGTVREVHAEVAKATGWARTTVKTLLERMETKGLLRSSDASGVRRYVAAKRRDELAPRAISAFLDRVLDDSLEPLVGYIADARGLSAADVAKLRALLERGGQP
ncbi:MAG: BlaI/MecI/CopY family transcriptional regulator [Planctomycetes bacterium]|nr:BlaI/MecI/CopY family transcriptional regulator [Planctomycetota bacterium]